MNLLENYLTKVHDIRPCREPWTKEEWAKDKEFIYVTATFECYGVSETNTRVYSKDGWEKIQEQGYYMG